MSTVKRLVSASTASWMKIGITMISQLVLVPLYLTYWDVTTYGIWIAILAFVDVVNTIDKGHQNYLGFEFLRLGSQRKEEINRYLWSGVWAGIGLSVLQLLFVTGIATLGFLPEMLGEKFRGNSSLIVDAAVVLVLQSFNWMISTSISGIFVRVLAPFGYYSRMAWWGVIYSIVATAAPVIAVSFGAGLIGAGVVYTGTTILYAIAQYYDVFRLFKKIGITYEKPQIKLGIKHIGLSTGLSLRELLESARRQGVRLLLSPLVGPAGVVAFSTMRTGANIALQGLNTITNPMMPELMRFLHKRDQKRMEASFSTVWFVLLFFLAPGVVILQVAIEPAFTSWTRGQVTFDPILFALLSLAVLVYAAAQPAMAIIRGNNLLKPQLTISILSALVAVSGIFILVPSFGISGAGLGLLLSEIVATEGYRIVAKKWLQRNGLSWPRKTSIFVTSSIWLSAAIMFGAIYFKEFRWMILAAGTIGFILLMRLYYKSLPDFVFEKLKSIGVRLPIVKQILAKSNVKA